MVMNKCQYIGADHTQPSCKCDAVIGRNYCEEHAAIIYQKGSSLRKRHKDVKKVDSIRLIESLMNEAIAELEEEGFDCYNKALEL